MASETSLSIGKHLRAALLDVPAVREAVSEIYPLINPLADDDTADVQFPYIAYAVTGMEAAPSKASTAPDKVIVELAVYDETYDGAVEVAEAVREALHDMRTPMIAGAWVINQKDDILAPACFMKIMTIKILTSQLR